ncbi:MAG TPA: hypothetical protein VEA40_11280 [Ramlibacter sp.]|nr:hypothetical protein [Ramlibacter sp.]
MKLQSARLDVSAAPGALEDWFEERGWTDGLPVVPPTPQLVEAMVAGSGLAPDAQVARVAPSGVMATVEKVAINAVMAGCRPAYMPVLLAAVRALSQPEFNLAGIQATTHPVAPVLFVNGPVRQRIGLNCGSNVFGQGFRANATIGRAIRLVLMNLGGGIPGKTDMSTQGSPAKFSFCAGENEEASPWDPYHVEHGMAREDSAVLVHGGEPPHNLQDHASASAKELLMTFASGMATLANNNIGMMGEMLLVVGPEHARILARGGLGKNDVRVELHRMMRLRFATMGVALRNFYRNRRPSINVGPEVDDIPYLDDPSQILIMVAGGPGLHSCVLPSFGGSSRAMLERAT